MKNFTQRSQKKCAKHAKPFSIDFANPVYQKGRLCDALPTGQAGFVYFVVNHFVEFMDIH